VAPLELHLDLGEGVLVAIAVRDEFVEMPTTLTMSTSAIPPRTINVIMAGPP
jgi:hypothetical protein